MEKVYYLGYYDIPQNEDKKRNVVLAATNKMDYIVSALERNGYAVTLISAALSKNGKANPAEEIPIGKCSTLHLPKSLKWGNKFQRGISSYYSNLQLFLILWKHIQKGDTLIAYHAMSYITILKLLKRIKKFKLVLEAEEIYADVNDNARQRKKENSLFACADAYIFPTELLNEQLNSENKPCVISYGTYQVEPERMSKVDYRTNAEWSKEKIHVVYAGTFDLRKGGAMAAAKAAEFLNDRYHVHLLGFGGEEDIKAVQKEMSDASMKSGCTVTYDGLLRGEEYIRFLQACDIGLSTHNPEGKFNDTSFPSKILSYMANGLQVVSAHIPVVERSAIGGEMYFYHSQAPKQIANAIKIVDLSDATDSREVVSKLDQRFTREIKDLLEK